jgi:hypothetical protein
MIYYTFDKTAGCLRVFETLNAPEVNNGIGERNFQNQKAGNKDSACSLNPFCKC